VDSRKVVRRLEAAGWKLVRTKGSHCQFKHPARPGRVTVHTAARPADRHLEEHRETAGINLSEEP